MNKAHKRLSASKLPSPSRHRGLPAVILLLSVLLNLSIPFPASAQNRLASLNAAGLNFVLSDDQAEQFRLQIKPRGGISNLPHDLTANVFAVENPTRLVIDIPQFVAKKPRTVGLKHPQLSSIRLGVHSDKTRLVIDIKKDVTPDYNVRSDVALGVVIVSFSLPSGVGTAEAERGSEEATSLEAKIDRAEAALRDPQVPSRPRESSGSDLEKEQLLASPEEDDAELKAFEMLDQLTAEQEEIVEQEAPRAPDTFVVRNNEQPELQGFELTPKIPSADSNVTSQARPSATGDTKVKGIFYQTTKNSGVSSIMVDVENLNTYSLTQREAGLYELLLSDAYLAGEHLALPQFPPDTFKGFQVIVASQAGENVVVKVYVEKDVKLSPFIAQGRLWLRASE